MLHVVRLVRSSSNIRLPLLCSFGLVLDSFLGKTSMGRLAFAKVYLIEHIRILYIELLIQEWWVLCQLSTQKNTTVRTTNYVYTNNSHE